MLSLRENFLAVHVDVDYEDWGTKAKRPPTPKRGG